MGETCERPDWNLRATWEGPGSSGSGMQNCAGRRHALVLCVYPACLCLVPGPVCGLRTPCPRLHPTTGAGIRRRANLLLSPRSTKTLAPQPTTLRDRQQNHQQEPAIAAIKTASLLPAAPTHSVWPFSLTTCCIWRRIDVTRRQLRSANTNNSRCEAPQHRNA
jgi:hypothetical protein